jgi:hypothetical protein
VAKKARIRQKQPKRRHGDLAQLVRAHGYQTIPQFSFIKSVDFGSLAKNKNVS